MACIYWGHVLCSGSTWVIKIALCSFALCSLSGRNSHPTAMQEMVTMRPCLRMYMCVPCLRYTNSTCLGVYLKEPRDHSPKKNSIAGEHAEIFYKCQTEPPQVQLSSIEQSVLTSSVFYQITLVFGSRSRRLKCLMFLTSFIYLPVCTFFFKKPRK